MLPMLPRGVSKLHYEFCWVTQIYMQQSISKQAAGNISGALNVQTYQWSCYIFTFVENWKEKIAEWTSLYGVPHLGPKNSSILSPH